MKAGRTVIIGVVKLQGKLENPRNSKIARYRLKGNKGVKEEK